MQAQRTNLLIGLGILLSTAATCFAGSGDVGRRPRTYANPGPLEPVLDMAAFATCP